jgi:hypothetical protein
VALQPYGAGIPAPHNAAQVDHKDRVINDGIYEQLETSCLANPIRF